MRLFLLVISSAALLWALGCHRNAGMPHSVNISSRVSYSNLLPPEIAPSRTYVIAQVTGIGVQECQEVVNVIERKLGSHGFVKGQPADATFELSFALGRISGNSGSMTISMSKFDASRNKSCVYTASVRCSGLGGIKPEMRIAAMLEAGLNEFPGTNRAETKAKILLGPEYSAK
ncbi:MAG: hypothetical protein A2X49_16570 [Lentisphaerae bacterium GWF2_52_8]|nr:MAG: hypothetical protein A2X49_16570 [Lentisphaerae bacterium GWF2_52_8]